MHGMSICAHISMLKSWSPATARIIASCYLCKPLMPIELRLPGASRGRKAHKHQAMPAPVNTSSAMAPPKEWLRRMSSSRSAFLRKRNSASALLGSMRVLSNMKSYRVFMRPADV